MMKDLRLRELEKIFKLFLTNFKNNFHNFYKLGLKKL